MIKGVGLFGGTFDPVHKGHLALAKTAIERCGLQKIVFIPAASPPHKINRELTDYCHRVEMLDLAIAGNENYSISLVEKNLTHPCYTVDTLEVLLKNNSRGDEYYFIIGIDAFLDIPTWKRPNKVLGNVHFIVFARPGYEYKFLMQCLMQLQYSKMDSYWYNRNSGKKVYYLEDTLITISSSSIRKKIHEVSDTQNLVPEKVLNYIKAKNLYKTK